MAHLLKLMLQIWGHRHMSVFIATPLIILKVLLEISLGNFVIEAGVNNISVITRNTDQMISKLNFDYKCTEK